MASPPSNRLAGQEQIAASHEFDGVRKEKERLTAAALIKKKHVMEAAVSTNSYGFNFHASCNAFLFLNGSNRI